MDSSWRYEIRVEEHLSDRWVDWFEGLAICRDPGGGTVLSGPLADQAALFGLLARIQALNLTLVSVIRCPCENPGGRGSQVDDLPQTP